MGSWISVKDRLPEDDRNIMGWHTGREASLPLICYYDEEEKAFVPLFCDQEAYVFITHWMPFPEPPKGKNNG